MIIYSVFVKEETCNGKEIFIWATDALILPNVRLFVSETMRASRIESQTANGYQSRKGSYLFEPLA